MLVDFKTDDPKGRKEPLRKAYAPQLEAYARIWHEVTGEKVVERYVFFTRTAEAEPV